MKTLATLILAILLAGCASIYDQYRFTPVAPQTSPAPAGAEQPARPANGSIYQAGRDMRLFEDRTARRVGDIITIRLAERTDASKKASTNMDKNSDTSIAAPTLLGNSVSIGGANLETTFKGERKFDGKGESDQSNSLKGQVSAIVTNVYPNGNLAIRGEKMLTLNQGEEFVQISGVVRPDDIAPDNSVLSTQVADAQITYAGNGAVADANAIGWLARFFVSALWPF